MNWTSVHKLDAEDLGLRERGGNFDRKRGRLGRVFDLFDDFGLQEGYMSALRLSAMRTAAYLDLSRDAQCSEEDEDQWGPILWRQHIVLYATSDGQCQP